MEDTTFSSLRSALRASPSNKDLFLVVLRAALDRKDLASVAELMNDNAIEWSVLKEHEHREIARAFIFMNEAEKAIEHLAGNEPETLLLKARANVVLGDLDAGNSAYKLAVAANPALEDKSLEAELHAKVIRLDMARATNQRKVAVEANDNTDASEVVRLLQPETRRVMFADVGGLDAIKKQIHRRIILPFHKPSLFERFRRNAGGGILLYGPPGCGKTLLARATAGECGAKFFNVAVSDILDMYIGESERKLHAIFEQARRNAPAIVFFDEVEALGGKRQYSREATSSKLVSQFLSELDGFAQNNQNVLIMGATNVPWAVDPAFRRPGRFDRVMFVPPPDKVARHSILQALLKDRPLHGEIDYKFLAESTSGFSGADLRDLVESAVDEAIESSIESGHEVPIAMEHLRASLKAARNTTTEWLTTARNYARYANEGGQYDEVLEFLDKNGKRN